LEVTKCPKYEPLPRSRKKKNEISHELWRSTTAEILKVIIMRLEIKEII
jgi:hypothetical protein